MWMVCILQLANLIIFVWMVKLEYRQTVYLMFSVFGILAMFYDTIVPMIMITRLKSTFNQTAYPISDSLIQQWKVALALLIVDEIAYRIAYFMNEFIVALCLLALGNLLLMIIYASLGYGFVHRLILLVANRYEYF